MWKPAAVLLLLLAHSLPALCQWSDDAQRCADATDPDQGLPFCNAAIQAGQLSPANLSITFNNRGGMYSKKGEFDQAIQDFHQAIRFNPGNSVAFRNEGDAFSVKGEYDEAIKDYDQANRIDPTNGLVINYRAEAYFKKGDYGLAIRDYSEAIRLQPNDSGILESRCNAYNYKGEYDLAIRDCDEAIRLNPKSYFGFTRRGIAYSNKQNQDQGRAIQDYDQAIQVNPKGSLAFLNRGVAYFRKGDHKRAIQDYDKAILLDPSYFIAWRNRSAAYFAMGKYDVAIEGYSRSLELKPKDVNSHYWLRIAYAHQGDYIHALEDLEREVPSESDPGFFWYRGQLNFDIGRFADAQSDLAKTQEPNPGFYAPLWFYLAQFRNGQDGSSDLEKNVASLDHKEWPGAIVDLYLGRLTPEEALAAAEDADKKKNREQHCEAYFYVGEYALMKGKLRQARKLFKKSVKTGVRSFIEYMGAEAELRRIQK